MASSVDADYSPALQRCLNGLDKQSFPDLEGISFFIRLVVVSLLFSTARKMFSIGVAMTRTALGTAR
jgi:hypothetical protein